MVVGQWICAILGVWLIYSALRAVRSGRLTLRNGLDIRRGQDRAAFWLSIGALAGFGLICLAIGLPVPGH